MLVRGGAFPDDPRLPAPDASGKHDPAELRRRYKLLINQAIGIF